MPAVPSSNSPTRARPLRGRALPVARARAAPPGRRRAGRQPLPCTDAPGRSEVVHGPRPVATRWRSEQRGSKPERNPRCCLPGAVRDRVGGMWRVASVLRRRRPDPLRRRLHHRLPSIGRCRTARRWRSSRSYPLFDDASFGFGRCNPEVDELRSRYAALAGSRDDVRFVDPGTVTSPDDTPEAYRDDGVHPTEEGSRLVGELLADAILAYERSPATLTR